jgi:hypothetical protein
MSFLCSFSNVQVPMRSRGVAPATPHAGEHSNDVHGDNGTVIICVLYMTSSQNKSTRLYNLGFPRDLTELSPRHRNHAQTYQSPRTQPQQTRASPSSPLFAIPPCATRSQARSPHRPVPSRQVSCQRPPAYERDTPSACDASVRERPACPLRVRRERWRDVGG